VPGGVAIRADRQVYDDLRDERQRTLVGPEDDMWATFADMAEPYALVVEGEVAGCCSIDDVHELHVLHVRSDFEERAAELFAHVVEHAEIVAALPSTVDPAFLSLSLAAGVRAEPVALMFEHVIESSSSGRVDLRLATATDHAAAVAFDRAATDSSEAFLDPFLAERIDRHELYVVESDGEIVATGECRVDQRARGHAHLGVVVGSDRRCHGLGTGLMHALVDVCRVRDLEPLCSTEPDNLAAQRVIRRAGFRSRHRVFRVMMTNTR
jgi:RimJ/RimL family protein N-acetyltransferase